MKSSNFVHPEALFSSIMDLQSSLEKYAVRCKIMVIHPVCYLALLNEDLHNNSDVLHIPSPEEKEKYGYKGMMWGTLVYTNTKQKFYEINAYGSNCEELLIDYPEIYSQAQEIIAGS
jgi:hypothetical protein